MSCHLEKYFETPVRAAAILTGSYVAGTVIDGAGADGVWDHNQLILYITFTIGSLTSLQVKVEFSADNSTYYQETFGSISTGTSTEVVGEHSFAATGNFRLAIPIKDRFIKVSAKGTGTVTSSSVAILAITGGV